MTDVEIGFMVINWFIAIIMLSGFSIVQFTKYELKNNQYLDEDKRMISEIFIKLYYSRDFSGKLMMIMQLGANIWSTILFHKMMNKEGD